MSTPRSTPGRMLLRAVVFLTIFALVLILVTNIYLIPSLAAAKTATDAEREQLSAYAQLILALVLFILFAVLILTFRVGRFFIASQPGMKSKPTVYVDAWAEAGRRLKTDDSDSDSKGGGTAE